MNQILKIGLAINILILLLVAISNGQSTVTGVEVFLKPIDPVAVKESANSGTTPYNVVYAITLSGTTDISNFHLKLGSTSGGSEKAAHVIPFDPGGSLPTGVTYARKNNTVYIGMGVHTDMENFHAEVQIEDKNGNKSGIVRPMQ